ncbi:uncharacterized protein [Branchiostoma lanceolatum]|uniref:uncharacterized protein n=1 Tax=Branchiostoma lanceolatum TaxID=7740 RepID=UPI0034541E91
MDTKTQSHQKEKKIIKTSSSYTTNIGLDSMSVSLSSLEVYTPDWKALSCDNTSPQPRHLTREDDGQDQSPGEWCRVGNQTTNNGVSLPFIGYGKGDLSDAALNHSTFLTGTWAQNYHSYS